MENPLRYRWVIEILLFVSYLVFGISWLAWSPLLSDLQKHFAIGGAQAALLISTVSVAKAFVPMLAGLLAARFGLKNALLAGMLLSALAIVAPHAPTFDSMLGVRFMFGVGGAIIVTLMGAAVMEWFPKRDLPMVNAANNVAVNTGICIALFATVPVSSRIGWPATLTLFGVLPVLVAVAWMVLGRSGPVARKSEAAAEPAPLMDVLRQPTTWILALAFVGPLSLYLGLNTWLPTHLQAAFSLPRQAASQLTGLFNLVGIPAAFAGGILTTRLGVRRPLIILSGLLMPPAAIGLFGSPDPAIRTASAAVLGAAFFLYVSPLFTTPMELPGATPRRVAVQMGVVFSLAYVVSFLVPILIGAVKDAGYGLAPGLTASALLSASLALGGWLLPETGEKRPWSIKLPRRPAAISQVS